MKTEDTCHRRTLAHRGMLQVDYCACGMLHVTFGAVTVRLVPAACEVFCGTLLEAMQQLTRQSELTMQ